LARRAGDACGGESPLPRRGAEGGREGVKLEQQVLIGPDGPELMMGFPWEEALL
jgi:hypothetical protein